MQIKITGSNDYPIWIDGYDDHGLLIQGKRYNHPIRICQTEISVVHKAFNSMQLGDFLLPDQSPPEVVIIGTGKKHLFLSPKLQVDLFTKQLYAETMPTSSAVHSFNLLTADKRRIFTWLWL